MAGRSSSAAREAGFTLVEIGVIVPIMIVFAIVMFNAVFDMMRTTAVQRVQTEHVNDLQTALDQIEVDAKITGNFTHNIDPTKTPDPYAPISGGQWSINGSGASDRVLLLSAYSTDTNPESNNRQPVFIGNAAVGECSSGNLYLNPTLRHTIVYFVDDNTLYRRKLINLSETLCNSQYQKLSCPLASTLPGGTRDAACQANDEVVIRHVSSFAVEYYATTSSTSALSVYGVGDDQTAVDTAAAASVTLSLSSRARGEQVTTSSNIRITGLNIVN